jgi:hypothetical protein
MIAMIWSPVPQIGMLEGSNRSRVTDLAEARRGTYLKPD